MKILIASTYVPFIKGGGTMIIDSLEEELTKRGYQVDSVRVPFHPYWQNIAQQTLAIRSLELTESAGTRVDRLITIRYPSYAIPHPNKVVWFLHHHRGAYDLWGTPHQDIPNTPSGLAFREALIKSDTLYLKECKKVFAISQNVANRLKRFNNIEADGVLGTPLPEAEQFYQGETGDYFIYSSRITPLKRQFMAVEAMRYVKADFRLVLVGTADVPRYMTEVKELISRYGLKERVHVLGWVPEKEKIKLLADAFAVLVLPEDEDGYTYAVLEALYSHKPVITFTDSGGPLEVVQHGLSGLVVEPDPKLLAEAMQSLWADRAKTIEMGKQAYESIPGLRIDWDYVIEELLS
jgi:glycosyltransferase involved in cell wall biosynthesis